MAADGELVTLGGGALRLARPRPDIAGRELEVGLRPEHLFVCEPGPTTLDAVVDWVEALGADTITHVRMRDGSGLNLRLPGTTTARQGDRLCLTAAPDQIHLFDATSGRRA